MTNYFRMIIVYRICGFFQTDLVFLDIFLSFKYSLCNQQLIFQLTYLKLHCTYHATKQIMIITILHVISLLCTATVCSNTAIAGFRFTITETAYIFCVCSIHSLLPLDPSEKRFLLVCLRQPTISSSTQQN